MDRVLAATHCANQYRAAIASGKSHTRAIASLRPQRTDLDYIKSFKWCARDLANNYWLATWWKYDHAPFRLINPPPYDDCNPKGIYIPPKRIDIAEERRRQNLGKSLARIQAKRNRENANR